MASPKEKEAQKYIAEAEKSLKTGFLKWSADYDTAANRYEKAAICYRNIRHYKEAKEAYIKAAESYISNNSIYLAAKSYEQAANVARDNKELIEAAELFNTACERFSESGHPDTGGQTLLKAAKLLQHDAPDKAAAYYMKSSEYLLINEKYREAANACKDAVRMYCRTRPRQLDKIIETCKIARTVLVNAQMINIAHETVVVQVIALLMNKNSLEAQECLQEALKLQEFATSEECNVLQSLTDAVLANDEESVTEYCNSRIFRAIDPEFAKLVRDLQSGKESAATTSAKRQHTKPTTTSENKSTSTTAVYTKKTPSDLANMRNQLLATSSSSSGKGKKHKVDSSPPNTPPNVSPLPQPKHDNTTEEKDKSTEEDIKKDNDTEEDTKRDDDEQEAQEQQPDKHSDSEEDDPIDVN